MRSDVRACDPHVPHGGEHMRNIDMRDNEDFLAEEDAYQLHMERKCWGTPDCGCPVCDPQEPEEEDEDESI